MNQVEDAYRILAASIINSASGTWDKLRFHTRILNKACSGMETTKYVGSNEVSLSLGMKRGFDVNNVALFLRNNLLAATGDRIWGLTFTLYPDGKFNIEYDYNKPEGYEETDETIEVNLSSLQP